MAETLTKSPSVETVEPFKPVRSRAAWRAAELRDREDEWIYHFTEKDIEELEAAIRAIEDNGKELQEVTLEDVAPSLASLGPKLRAHGREASHGRGFQILRGLPVRRWSRETGVRALWAIGLHWGTAVPTNARGHLIGHVADVGLDPDAPTTRLYATSAAQPFHNDAADLVALLCLRPALSGGESYWASSQTVHNEVLARRPELVSTLAEPFYWDRKGEIPEGEDPWFSIPAFNYHAGGLSVNWSSNYFVLAQRHAEVPRLTDAQKEAIQLVDDLAADPELHLSSTLQEGDIQLLSNHTVLHARAAFTDDTSNPDERRHLLRLWLAPEEDRPLPEVYAQAWTGTVEPGRRGGIRLAPGHRLTVPLEP